MIEEAYKEEQAYLSDKLKGIDTVFADRLKLYGFTLEQYQAAKQDYLFQLTPPVVRPINIADAGGFNKALATVEAVLYIPIFVKEYIAFVGTRNEIYEDQCAGEDVEIVHTKFHGGTIIESRDDVHVMISMPTKLLNLEYFNNKILALVQKYEPDVYIDNNDFMLAGAKVAGTSFFATEVKQFYGINITFADVSELCKKILPPRSVKPVGFLSGGYRDALEADIILAFNGVV